MDNLSKEVGLIVISSSFLLLIAVGVIALVMVYRRKQVEYIHEQNRMKAAFEKELLEAQLEMQEQTMKHLAQEIHDNVGGTLTLAKLNLNTIRAEQANGSTEKIGNAKELVTKAIADLRTLSKTLHTEAVLSVGIAKAIEMELKLINKTAAFDATLSINGEPISIDQQKELILFRTVQEALNNAMKHSGASKIHVVLSYQPTKLEVVINDNGKGFNLMAIEKNSDQGSGLRNMQNRTRLIGGEFLVDGQRGTTIQISLPIIAA
jgi:signal transduction histidine kinase